MAKRELLISEESAKAQIDLFFDWYGMDFDEMLESADSGRGVSAAKVVLSKLTKVIRQGLVEISEETDNGEPTLLVKQTFTRPIKGKESVTYHEVTGNARAAIKPGADANDTARMYQFLGVLSREDHLLFRSLRGADIGTTDALGFFFLLV